MADPAEKDYSPVARASTMDVGPHACAVCMHENPPHARFCAQCGGGLTADARAVQQGQDDVDPLLGRVIAGRYRILSRLGKGGMGVVYKVEHVHIGKLMAMKLLHGQLARDRTVVRRFQREAEAASRLHHPNTVQIFDFGRDQGLMYLVMEYLDGRDLGEVLKSDGPLPLPRMARILAQVCGSVAEAHRLGIIHRDLKPENIMIVPGDEGQDVVRVLDFGLAKLRHQDAGLSLTQAGHIVGTPYYMAPEAVRGENVDARADVYSLGAVLYKGLVGAPPFWAPTPIGVLTKHLTESVTPPSARVADGQSLPPVADEIVLRAMAKEPDARFEGVEAMGAALLVYLNQLGERFTDSALRLPSGTLAQVAPGSSRVVPVATRNDVDAFERRIRRRSWLGYSVGAALLLSTVASVALIIGTEHLNRAIGQFFAPPVHEVERTGRELEPNNTPAEANPLPLSRPVAGYLGKRQDIAHGDHDVYTLSLPEGRAAKQPVRIELAGLPNMDLVFELVRVGQSTPVLVAQSGGVGEAERVPNFPMTEGRYLLRVREAWTRGQLPTENVSDTYRLVWSVHDPAPTDEREVNDSLELAEPIELGKPRTGYLGWAGDVDLYCLSEDASRVSARVTAPAGVDVVLRVVHRRRQRSVPIDAHGVGAPEASDEIKVTGQGQLCFEVAADDAEGAPSNADDRYQLLVEAVN